MNIQGNSLLEVCRTITDTLDRLLSWGLSPEEKDHLVKRIKPHAVASGAARLPDPEKSDLIRKISLCYFQDGPAVEQIIRREGLSDQYLEFVKRVIYGKCFSKSSDRWVLPDGQQVDDFISEVWVKVLAGITGFNFKSRFTTWMEHIIVNTFYELHRREKARGGSQKISFDQPYGAGTRTLAEILPAATVGPNPIKEKEEDLRTERIINKFQRESKRNLWARQLRLEGYKHKEIAQKLNIPINTVSTILSRIKKTIEKAESGTEGDPQGRGRPKKNESFSPGPASNG